MCGAFLDYYAGATALQSEEYDKAMDLFKSSSNTAADMNLVNKASARDGRNLLPQKRL